MQQESSTPPTAGLVVIGNEILSGKVEDTNSPYLCRELNFLGVQLARIATIPDDFELISRTVREFSDAFTWVFTSGGVGPTHDDITIDAIAAGFDVPVQIHPRLEKALRDRLGERMTDGHLQMAKVPEGSELIDVPELTHPQVQFRNVIILPGVPELFRIKFNAIKSRFAGEPLVLREMFLRGDEAAIAGPLREVAERRPDVQIGSYPTFRRDEYSVKITLEGRDAVEVGEALSEVQAGLASLAVEVVRVT